MCVHYGGYIQDRHIVESFVRHYELRLIEDAAHSFGNSQADTKRDDFPYDLLCYSFDGIKNITTGEGGAVVTRNKADAARLSDIRFLGVRGDQQRRRMNRRTWIPDVQEQGWRAHMSNINAAIGLAQLERSEVMWERRKWVKDSYDKYMRDGRPEVIPVLPRERGLVPHIYPVLCRTDEERMTLMKHLMDQGIEVGRHYCPLTRLAVYKEAGSDDIKNTDDIYNRSLSLPLHPDLGKVEIERICYALDKYYER